MAKNIRGNRDGENNRNESYNIPSRGDVPRDTVVKEVKEGKHPNHNVIEREGEEYVRSNPDRTKKNNVNKDE